jgi:hypothetical protein
MLCLLHRPRRRTFEAIVQGRFKRRVSFASVYTGQIFSQPFLALPPVWICRTVRSTLSAHTYRVFTAC